MKFHPGFLTLFALCAFAAAISAQTAPPQPGEHVRISAPRFSGGVIDGIMRNWLNDTAVVTLRKDTTRVMSVPKNLIIGMEVQRGKKRSILVGALIGAAVGAGSLALATSSESELPGLRNLAIVIAGGGGFLIGGLVGSQVKSDRWEPVRIDSPPIGSVGLQFGIRIRF